MVILLFYPSIGNCQIYPASLQLPCIQYEKAAQEETTIKYFSFQKNQPQHEENTTQQPFLKTAIKASNNIAVPDKKKW